MAAFKTLEEVGAHLNRVDGGMLGRAAYHNPYVLEPADRLFFGASGAPQTRCEILQRLLPYVKRQLRQGVRLHCLTRHILGLFQGVPGARAWRRCLSEQAHRSGAGVEVLHEAARRAAG